MASGNPEMDQEEVTIDVPTEASGEDIVAIPEARVPKTLKNPALPTAAEWESHCLTHNPYQSWCRCALKRRARRIHTGAMAGKKMQKVQSRPWEWTTDSSEKASPES